MIILVFISILISLKHWILFLTTFGILVLGLIYNFISRYFLFMDVTVVTATHHAIPMFSTALLLKLSFIESIKISIFVYIVYWLFVHIKNLKGIGEDKQRNYKTIGTVFNAPKKIGLIFFELSFILMFMGYFLFNFKISYLFFIVVLYILKTIITQNIILGNCEKALNFLRFMSVFFVYSIVLQFNLSTYTFLFCSIPIVSSMVVTSKELDFKFISNIKFWTEQSSYQK